MDVAENIYKIIEILSQRIFEDPKDIEKLFRKYPKLDGTLYKRSDIMVEVSKNASEFTKEKISILQINLQTKKVRTISGVTPVTVLTKPFPCPGRCIFCPNDVRMPKSYLSDEPGAQRAARNKFDPYAQTYNRLVAYKAIGHPTDKIELIILGGTWTSYPEAYQIWFVKRCFDAMNDFQENTPAISIETDLSQPFDESKLEDINGEEINKTYNQVVSLAILPKAKSLEESSTWENLFEVQKINEQASTRCIGLVIETRPDEINEEEVIRIRKLGATKVQIGFQSLNDDVLLKNNRGHDVQTTRNAVNLLRRAGFKIHAHWMPNLYGSSPENDISDFKKMFSEGDFMPDELKVYPCSLIASAELMQYYKNGLWKPYTRDELVHVLKEIFKLTPSYCRITRMIRDIGSHDIVTGNKTTNIREIVENELKKEKVILSEIRSREIRDVHIQKSDLHLDIYQYITSVSDEYFLQYVTKENKIAGFLRLSLPFDRDNHFIEELKGSAIIREIHIYGPSIEIGESEEGKPQHLGLGKSLIEKAKEISTKNRYKKLAVISSIGTREYYKNNGFINNFLYQIQSI